MQGWENLGPWETEPMLMNRTQHVPKKTEWNLRNSEGLKKEES